MRDDLSDAEEDAVALIQMAALVQRRETTQDGDVLKLCRMAISSGRAFLESEGWNADECDEAELGHLKQAR